MRGALGPLTRHGISVADRERGDADLLMNGRARRRLST